VLSGPSPRFARAENGENASQRSMMGRCDSGREADAFRGVSRGADPRERIRALRG
jgi:hypothetical protein